MNIANQIIVHGLTVSKTMTLRFCQDLSPEEQLRRPTPACNCAAWLLGHLALTDRRILSTFLGVADLPPLPDGFEQRFSRENGAPQAETFGDVSILPQVFAENRDRLIAVAASADEATLSRPIDPPHPRFKTVGDAMNFMSLHTLLHAGQISTIRRTLDRPPII